MGIGSVLGAVSSGIGIVKGLSGGKSSGGGGGNVAGGAYYDPYGDYRGTSAQWLNALLFPGQPLPPGASSLGGGGEGALSFDAWKSAQGPQQSAYVHPQGAVMPFPAGTFGPNYGTNTGARDLRGDYDKYLAGYNASHPTSGGGQGVGDWRSNFITQMPGYQFGIKQGNEQLERRLAATGQTSSGAERIALQDWNQQYAGSYYDKMVGWLSQLSGATQGPLSMAASNNLNYQQQQARQSGLMQGLGGLASVFGDSSTGGWYGNQDQWNFDGNRGPAGMW